jgi:DnaJ-class molecular chaperone
MATKTCPECGGEGLVTMSDELEDGTVTEWEKVCTNCGGSGTIEDDD